MCISLLCILSKVLERIVYNSMLKHVEGSLTKHQFSYLPNRSTLQQLLTFTNEILEAKTEVDLVYMNFRKAFDSVSHNGFLTNWHHGQAMVMAEGVLAATIPMCQNR